MLVTVVTVFSTPSQREIVILEMFNLLYINAFNLVMSKNLSFGKGLILLAPSHKADVFRWLFI